MKKRIGSFFLAIVMLFTLVVPAFAQSITLGVDKDTVKAGEDVTVTVNFNENLENVEPADATEDTADANPTE